MNTLFLTCLIVSSLVQTLKALFIRFFFWIRWLLVKNIYPIQDYSAMTSPYS